MLQAIYVDVAKNQIGFISDKEEQSEQIQELTNPDQDIISREARARLNMPGAGISDTLRVQYDQKNNKLVASAAETRRAKDEGVILRSAVLYTFDSLSI